MAEHIAELLPDNIELSDEQKQIIHLIQGHVTLQDQFGQLTKHVEQIYTRLNSLEKLISNRILS